MEQDYLVALDISLPLMSDFFPSPFLLNVITINSAHLKEKRVTVIFEHHKPIRTLTYLFIFMNNRIDE